MFGSSLLGTVSISDTRMLHPESIPSRTTNRVVRPGTGAATITLTPQASSAPFFVMKRLVAAFDSTFCGCAARTRAHARQEHTLPRGDTTI